jgi:hypothetical protein
MNKSDLKDDPECADFLTPTYDCYEDDEVPPSNMPDIDDVKNEDDVDTYDQYVGAHVRVTIGYEIRSGEVVQSKRELDVTVRGRANANYMKLIFLMAEVMSILPIKLQKKCMPSVTLRAGSII